MKNTFSRENLLNRVNLVMCRNTIIEVGLSQRPGKPEVCRQWGLISVRRKGVLG